MLDVKDQGENAVVPAPRICMILLTYKRTDLAVRTIEGVCKNLDYPKELLSLYIADDGSPKEHIDALLAAADQGHLSIAGYHNEKFRPDTTFCGMGWNTALARGHQNADILLWLEDDWELQKPLDIRPYVWMLTERGDVGLVRLGPLAVGSDMRSVGHRGVHYLEYLRTTAYAYSGNSLLRHVRFSEYYGLFDIGCNPGDIELHFDQKFRDMPDGPNIWRPAGIDPWGAFGHIGKEKTW